MLENINLQESYTVNLNFFSGPMDLLLHLVNRQEVSIEKVEMSLIAEQYLDIISKAALLDLEKATEFLVIAATLIAIKSQSLLPEQSEMLNEDNYDPEYLEQLRMRLKQYEQTKLQAIQLNSSPQLGINAFTRVNRKELPKGTEDLEDNSDPMTLGSMFYNLLKRIGETVNSMKISFESISIVDFMMKIVDSFQDSEGQSANSFKELTKKFSRNYPKDQARGVVIGSFIAVLELVKRGVVTVSETGSASDFQLSARTDQEDSNVINLADYREDPEEINLEEKKEVNRG